MSTSSRAAAGAHVRRIRNERAEAFAERRSFFHESSQFTETRSR